MVERVLNLIFAIVEGDLVKQDSEYFNSKKQFLYWYLLTGVINASVIVLAVSTRNMRLNEELFAQEPVLYLFRIFLLFTLIGPILVVIGIGSAILTSPITVNYSPALFIISISFCISPLVSYYFLQRPTPQWVKEIKSKQLRLQKKRERSQFYQLQGRIQSKIDQAAKNIEKDKFKAALRLFKEIKKDLISLEKKASNSALRREVKKKISELAIDEKVNDMEMLLSIPTYFNVPSQITGLIKQKKFTEALNKAESLEKKFISLEKVTIRYNLPVTNEIKFKRKSLQEYIQQIETELMKLVQSLEMPVVQHDDGRLETTRFFCQLCQGNHLKTKSYYQCDSCERKICLDCYLESVTTGKNTCIYCDGALVHQKRLISQREEEKNRK